MMGVPESDRPELARLSRISIPLGDAEFGDFGDALRAAFDLIEYAKALQRERRRKSRPTICSPTSCSPRPKAGN